MSDSNESSAGDKPSVGKLVGAGLLGLGVVLIAVGFMRAHSKQMDARAVGGTVSAERGKALFESCATCHGAEAQGNADLNAPGIAGLPAWYTTKQLLKFKNGERGNHPEDISGMQMRPMARMLASSNAAASVAAYIESLPPHQPAHTVEAGDAEKGKTAYMTCAACHGMNGEGNQLTGGPPMARLDDWYMLKQIDDWRKGIRYGTPADPQATAMAAIAPMLSSDETVSDILAYVRTLSGEAAAAPAPASTNAPPTSTGN